MDDIKKIKTVYKNIIKLLKIVLTYKKSYIIILFIISIINTMIPFVSMFISQYILNNLQIGGRDINGIIFVIIFYAVLKLIGITTTVFNSYVSNKYRDYLYYEMNIFFHQKCTELKYADFENDIIYDMLQRAEQEIGIRPISIINNILGLFSSIIGFIISMIILSSWHPWVILGFIVLPIFSYKYFVEVNQKEYKMQYERAEIERKSWYYTHLLIKDYFIKEIKLLDVSDYIMSKYNAILEIIFNQNITINKNRCIFNWLYQFLNTSFAIMIVVFSMIEAFYGKILLGTLTTYINTTSKVESSISNIANYCFGLYTDGIYSANILNFLNVLSTRVEKINNSKNEKIIIKEIQEIEIKNLSYKYPKTNKYALEDISLKLKADTITAIVGENGSGKTTLIKILTGLYDDYEGDILINGIDLKKIDMQSYRLLLSVVFQDYNNYELTVTENIAISDVRNPMDMTRVINAAKLSGANKIIEYLPNKYQQQLGNWFDNGIQLSGGEWQKIAIARGIYRDANIYILDEPTAALDPSSEYIFMKHFLKIINEKIGLFITHRFVNAKIADNILVIKDGKLIEQGNHDILMEKNGEYAKLYNIQLGEMLRKAREKS